MAKRKQYDWDAINADYNTGLFSDSDIERKHKCTRQALYKCIARDKKSGEREWKKNLRKSVKKATTEKMLKSDAEEGKKLREKVTGEIMVTPCNPDDAIDLASDFQKYILDWERGDIAKLRALELKLIDLLFNDPTKLYLAQYQGKIIQKKVALTASELAQAANNLANVQHKRIQLERQAYSLGPDDGEVESIEFDLAEKKAIHDAARMLATKIKKGGDNG